MLTIDDMLSQVAKITGAVPTKSPEVKKTEPPKADVHIKEINGLIESVPCKGNNLLYRKGCGKARFKCCYYCC